LKKIAKELFPQDFKDNFLWLEDVYLTGILPELGHIERVGLGKRFLLTWPYLSRDFVGVHMRKTEAWKRYQIWKSLGFHSSVANSSNVSE